ncbi:MAG TPA: hypothetical protein VML55_14965, partial [Planctomycetaceae bacterium]|nr:hypothetical protein [Planctomycetaceae bacterium]
SRIRQSAPKTWAYLERHADALDRRASSIYRNRPRFAMFGIGEYTFAPWKVAISGLHKKLAFAVVGPQAGKPVVLDDTCAFLPCGSADEAEFVRELLGAQDTQAFYSSQVFWDAKRPITTEILNQLDLHRLTASEGLLGSRFGSQTLRDQTAQKCLFATHY